MSPPAANASTIEQTAQWLRERLGALGTPGRAIVTGSGLGALAAAGRELWSAAYGEIPGLPAGPAVEGHGGRWRLIELTGKRLHLLEGRRHLYEGFDLDEVIRPVRLLAALGVRELLLTNAAGGLAWRLEPGDLMLAGDHINAMGARAEWHAGTPIYDPTMNENLRKAALGAGIDLKEGVYAGLKGPNYETPAEVAALRRMGADAVGMSTVPEALAARGEGMRVAAISVITNVHRPGAPPPSHGEVLRAGAQAAGRLSRLIEAWINASERHE